MNRIEKLLQTLAPKGVEFRKIKDIATFRRGSFPQPYTEPKWYGGDNSMPFIQVIDFADTMQLNEKSKQSISKLAQPKSVFVPKGTIIVTLQGTIGKVAITQYDAYVDRTIAIFTSYLVNINKKFFAYTLHQKFEIEKEYARGSTLKTITKEEFSDFLIPIPPLEIQQEIVKILDAFTELNTELKARKKQYEYYQNMLLDFNDINQNHKDAKMSVKPYPKRLKTLLQTLAPKGVGFKTLEEVFEIKNGYTPSKNNPEFWENGTIPWFRMEDIRENGRILKDSIQHITPKALKGKKLFPKNSIIISTTATIGEHALLIVDSLANQRFTFLSKKANCDSALDMKFFFYQCFLLGEWCKNNTNVSGFASVDMTAFKKYKFPIPPLEIQQEIVTILDQFSLLTTDLLAGIPAEIKARKKQYEYYREKLLTFKPLTPHKEVRKC
ncbi:type I restriction endonuclease subunit S [Helicobacter pylori X47-2AL]|uniref:Type I restriction endonuclease subunit S n=1 Tax=Helicobacter pylori X47-2AL TaxID=1386083 RepID=V6LJZ7_HELPX|nr:restriction endonuclease subunit S [Helicobacter pylori]EST41064.1 type I restriction endonuclease subunit S [Helicobacter pylori X47-2AL]MUT73957.1 restriction endonuclease subunit S [Helicobacter pylori]